MEKRECDDADYYKILGVSKNATNDELKKAFKTRVLKYHPDKGGDERKFKELVHAYQFLSDPEKRSSYDDKHGRRDSEKPRSDQDSHKARSYDHKYGHKDKGKRHEDPGKRSCHDHEYGRDPHGKRSSCGHEEGHEDARSFYDDHEDDDLEERFGSWSWNASKRMDSGHYVLECGEDYQLRTKLEVSLEDLYLGTEVKYSLVWKKICSYHGKHGLPSMCRWCQGSGWEDRPRLFDMVKGICRNCRGTGEDIYVEDLCPWCRAENIFEGVRVFRIRIEKGMHHRDELVFNHHPGQPIANKRQIIFVLCLKDHPKFKRKCWDLVVEHKLSIFEALCGFQFVLRHLDGRKLLIKSRPGEVVKPDSWKAVEKEGMPLFEYPGRKGSLYLHFQVEFPDSLCPNLVKSLLKVVRPKSKIPDSELDECEETTLRDVKIEDEMERWRRNPFV